jgi:hypothetical protein
MDTTMKELIQDIGNLLVKHKLTIIAVLAMIFVVSNYQEIKQGFIEGYTEVRGKQTK